MIHWNTFSIPFSNWAPFIRRFRRASCKLFSQYVCFLFLWNIVGFPYALCLSALTHWDTLQTVLLRRAVKFTMHFLIKHLLHSGTLLTNKISFCPQDSPVTQALLLVFHRWGKWSKMLFASAAIRRLREELRGRSLAFWGPWAVESLAGTAVAVGWMWGGPGQASSAGRQGRCPFCLGPLWHSRRGSQWCEIQGPHALDCA